MESSLEKYQRRVNVRKEAKEAFDALEKERGLRFSELSDEIDELSVEAVKELISLLDRVRVKL